MADKTYTDLDAAEPLSGAEILSLTQNGSSVKATLQAIANRINEVTSTPVSSPAFKGARMQIGQTYIVQGDEPVEWGNDEYNTDGFWALSAPTRITIPSGVTKAEIRASLNGNASIRIVKNGGETETAERQEVITTGTIPVTQGDYFEVLPHAEVSPAVGIGTFFEVEVKEHSI